MISYTDLESDYVNPIDHARRVNTVILPEMIAQSAIAAFMLLTGNYLEFAVNLPLVIWNGRAYVYQLHKHKVIDWSTDQLITQLTN